MNNKKKVIIGIVIFVLLITIGGGIYYTIYKDVTDRDNFSGETENLGNIPVETINQDIESKIQKIVSNGPQTSSNPFDYINVNKDIYEELKSHAKETFEFAIKDLIDTNANNGLMSYIEALLCSEINTNFEYDFESANDYLNNYKKFLIECDCIYNEYDNYAKSLLK